MAEFWQRSSSGYGFSFAQNKKMKSGTVGADSKTEMHLHFCICSPVKLVLILFYAARNRFVFKL